MDDSARIIQILANQTVIIQALLSMMDIETPHYLQEALLSCQKKSQNLMPLYAEDELPEN